MAIENNIRKVFIVRHTLENRLKNEILSYTHKQRISVARLFLKDPDLVILDEVTSSMDERTAESVYLEVLEKYKSKIIIIISHSPFVEKFATRVLKVENKRLVES